jgi:hypothetical protein
MTKYLLIPFLSIASLFVSAKEVLPRDAAEIAAKRCIALAGNIFRPTVKSIKTIRHADIPCYHIVRFDPDGWALVSADDRSAPILAYSPDGDYIEDNIPPAQQELINEYVESISAASLRSSLPRHPAWDNPLQMRAGISKVEPLIKVQWNQSSPYNKYCPTNQKGQRALVGCVAVALAQAMSVYQYPDRPKGRNGYTDDDCGLVNINYDREKPYDWAAIMTGAEKNDETARLLYHCGVAVKMDYGADGSGAYMKNIVPALSTYFSYEDDARYFPRNNYKDDWKQLILNELFAGRPVIYEGTNDKGNSSHAFNIDGYDGGDSFHLNWGWGGANNAYFTLENLNDGKFNYINSHGAIVNIRPKATDAGIVASPSPTLSIYISPAGEHTVEVPSSGQYALYNITGTRVDAGFLPAGRHTLPILRQLPPSVYILTVESAGIKRAGKIIISK